jgi:hypothetical protein
MTVRFTLTQQHIDLVSNMYVDYNDHTETGAPYIDPKRPYGNSDVPGDIADILDIPIIEDDGYMDPKQESELLALHRETETALQIILKCKTFEPGVFERPNPYQLGWRRIT